MDIKQALPRPDGSFFLVPDESRIPTNLRLQKKAKKRSWWTQAKSVICLMDQIMRSFSFPPHINHLASKGHRGNPVLCGKIVHRYLIKSRPDGLMWTYRKHFLTSVDVNIFFSPFASVALTLIILALKCCAEFSLFHVLGCSCTTAPTEFLFPS